MKTLIIGANGMLGRQLARVFVNQKPVLWGRKDVDITDFDLLEKKITNLKPDLVINAAAYTKVDDCEKNEFLAHKINAQAPTAIAIAVAKLGSVFVHFSTDYVFDGSKKAGYLETDKPNPINAYGRTKLAGEKGIAKSGLKNYHIIRTSWLYGLGGKNFVETMLTLSAMGKPIKVVNDQFGCPTLTQDLAEATKEILENRLPAGVYHCANSGVCSWYEFAKEIFKVFDVNADLNSCITKEYPTPAERPQYSVLKSKKITPMRPWQEALADYKKELIKKI